MNSISESNFSFDFGMRYWNVIFPDTLKIVYHVEYISRPRSIICNKKISFINKKSSKYSIFLKLLLQVNERYQFPWRFRAPAQIFAAGIFNFPLNIISLQLSWRLRNNEFNNCNWFWGIFFKVFARNRLLFRNWRFNISLCHLSHWRFWEFVGNCQHFDNKNNKNNSQFLPGGFGYFRLVYYWMLPAISS